jgi:hypothetical protein
MYSYHMVAHEYYPVNTLQNMHNAQNVHTVELKNHLVNITLLEVAV